jgi:hypothetical protein
MVLRSVSGLDNPNYNHRNQVSPLSTPENWFTAKRLGRSEIVTETNESLSPTGALSPVIRP